MQALYDYATKLGVSIEYTNLKGRIGGYRHDRRHIRIQTGMLYRKERCVLAHELGHATYGDEPDIFGRMPERVEDRADEWAAHFLIDPAEYRFAEEKYGTNTEWIAQELCVLRKLVVAYERTLLRIGDEVFVNARMGAGQWSQKVTA